MNFIKTLFGKLWDALFSSSNPITAVADAVDDTAKAVQKGEDLVHDHNENVAGQDKIIAENNAEAARVSANVAKTAVATTDAVALDQLRDGIS